MFLSSLLFLFWLSHSASDAYDKVLAARCTKILAELEEATKKSNVSRSESDTFQRISAEEVIPIRNNALIIYDDVLRHGFQTEVGAHGKDLSWKWLGLTKEGLQIGRNQH